MAIRRAAAAISAAAGAVAPCFASSDGGPPASEVLQGEYENRLRRHAAPEKLFEYFASVDDPETGEALMVPEDIVRALVPYNRLLGGKVGSPNPKFRYSAHKDRASPTLRAAYIEAVAALSASTGPDDAAARVLELRLQGGIDNGTHLAAIRAAGLTHGRFTELLEAGIAARGGAEADEARGAAVARELASLRRWASFAALADHDGDGDVDFGEFVMLLTLLELGAGREDAVGLAFRAFDADRSGVLEPSEARAMLASLAGESAVGSRVRDRGAAAGELGRLERARTALLDRVGGGRRLTLPALRGFRDSIAAAVRRAEFDGLDVDGSGRLSRREFARLFVSRVTPEAAEALVLRAADRLGDADDGPGICSEDVRAVEALLERADDLELALRVAAHAEGCAGGGVSRSGLRRACRAVLGRGEGLSEEVEAVLVALFDADGDGKLAAEELCGALRSAGSRDLSRPRGAPFVAALRRVPVCAARSLGLA